MRIQVWCRLLVCNRANKRKHDPQKCTNFRAVSSINGNMYNVIESRIFNSFLKLITKHMKFIVWLIVSVLMLFTLLFSNSNVRESTINQKLKLNHMTQSMFGKVACNTGSFPIYVVYFQSKSIQIEGPVRFYQMKIFWKNFKFDILKAFCFCYLRHFAF